MTTAKQTAQSVQTNGYKITNTENVTRVNLTDRCVHIFFEDGSDLFITSENFNELKFKAQRGE